jgi:hypothetical protein
MASGSTTREKWTSILEKFSKSGKSANKWCKEEGISYQRLLFWKKRLNQDNNPYFIELKDEPKFELHCRDLKITFSKIEDLKILAQLLSSLC